MIMQFRAIHYVLALAMAVHAGMLIYDLDHPDIFLYADRAGMRFHAAQGLLIAMTGADVAGFLASHGTVGDYAFHAVLLGLGGAPLVIIFQVLLTLLAGYGIYRICILLGWDARLSVSASALYLVFPHSIVFPHQLGTEALHTPLLILSLWTTTVFLVKQDAERGSCVFLILAALCAGMATLIRPVTLLWPLLVGLVISIMRRHKAGAMFTLVAYAPVLVWIAFIGLQTGNYGMGESSFDMPHNLYQRVLRISQTLPQKDVEQIRQTFLSQGEIGVMRTADYIQFALNYPVPFIKHSLRDIGIFVAKSGLERITIDYLGLAGDARLSIQDGQGGWRRRLDQEGLGATFRYLWQTQGMVLALSVIGSVVFIAVFLFSILGARCLLSGQQPDDKWKKGIIVLFVLLPLYILLFSQVVNAMQSRHRAPAEGALAMLTVAGVACFTRRRSMLATGVQR